MGISSILSSHVLSKRLPSLQSYLLLGGVIVLTYGLLTLYYFPVPEDVSIPILLAAIASGLLRAIAVTLMLYMMRHEEISQIIAVVFTYPVFVAVMAAPLLGELLSSMHWFAVIIVVIGAIIISIKKSPSGSTTWLGKILLLLFGISLLFALADIASKYAIAYITSWNLLSITAFSIAAVWWAIAIRPRIFRELNLVWGQRLTAPLIVFAEVLATTGTVMLFWAMERGPVSLVSAIAGSRPIFVAIYSIVLSRLAPQFLIWSGDKITWALRLIATIMIVIGISIIYLT